ncbi:DUF5819 family protein [Rhodococcus sp. IEGM 1318]|uniref:DUF5819 family protein n=1 Tax=Rhodococcus sp. IEGM 1318 TaxID=3082226 RepID=UPI002952FE7A|nr:DUF5819 family protein [Rhodococcus sp. IEGM 1318]MDV8004836.1 DUF5819 family protein [Rhodococcus sp. IEGM 1318]
MKKGHAIVALCGVFLLTVFSMGTFLYNIPQGPLREKANSVVKYMDPWLTQNWSLFAPDPPSSDIGILVRFSDLPEGDESQPFVDVTTPGLASTKEKIIPPREYRMLTSSLDNFLSAEDSVVSFHADARDFGSRLVDRERLVNEVMASNETPEETKSAYLRARQMMIEAVKHFYQKTASNPIDGSRAVQLRLVNYIYPRFEEKNLPESEKFDFRTLPWWKEA